MFTLAFLDQIFILHIFVTRLAVEPSPVRNQHENILGTNREPPFGFLCRLRNEESNRVGRDFGHVRVDADFWVSTNLLGLDFYCQQE